MKDYDISWTREEYTITSKFGDLKEFLALKVI